MSSKPVRVSRGTLDADGVVMAAASRTNAASQHALEITQTDRLCTALKPLFSHRFTSWCFPGVAAVMTAVANGGLGNGGFHESHD
jgi:hypothetical protein